MNDTTTSDGDASGRFVLRIDPRLHEVLRTAARRAGVSLNEYCARRLSLPIEIAMPLADALARSIAQFDDRLIGVAVFGSWARGQEVASSDIDLMIVIADDAPIGRGLYRAWDEAPLEWMGHRVEPHFVHLPAPDARISGIWAELAIDAIMLYEHDMQISRRLVAIRHHILAGRIVQKRANGQRYWVQAA